MQWIQFALSQLDTPEPIITAPSSDGFLGLLIVSIILILVVPVIVRICIPTGSIVFAISCGFVAVMVQAVFIWPWPWF